MSDEKLINVKCHLCGGSTWHGLRFCSGCITRAEEAIEARVGDGYTSYTTIEVAAIVARERLQQLYPGQVCKKNIGDVDLIMLAVTVSHDLKMARANIERLEESLTLVNQARLADQDLADLIDRRSDEKEG